MCCIKLYNAYQYDVFVFSPACRLTGRAVFKRTLLAKQGKLVLIHDQKSSCSMADLAEYVKQEIEAVTGDSLTAYNMS